MSLWNFHHAHLFHVRLKSLIFDRNLDLVQSIPFDSIPCQLAKQPVLPFNKSGSHIVAPYDLIRSNWG